VNGAIRTRFRLPILEKRRVLGTRNLDTHNDFFIDLPYFSRSSIASASAFVCPRNFILEEVIVTRNTWTATNDERERSPVMLVMQIINPHIQFAVPFDVLFSSSLLSFPGDFHGTAKHLDDGGAPSDVGETSLHNSPCTTPMFRSWRTGHRWPKLFQCVPAKCYIQDETATTYWRSTTFSPRAGCSRRRIENGSKVVSLNFPTI
jgi:hypothetical protein